MPGQKPVLSSSTEAQSAECGDDALIDDGEDNNNQTAVREGRGGYWYTYVDESDIDEIIEEHLQNGRIVERLRM